MARLRRLAFGGCEVNRKQREANRVTALKLKIQVRMLHYLRELSAVEIPNNAEGLRLVTECVGAVLDEFAPPVFYRVDEVSLDGTITLTYSESPAVWRDQ